MEDHLVQNLIYYGIFEINMIICGVVSGVKNSFQGTTTTIIMREFVNLKQQGNGLMMVKEVQQKKLNLF